MRAIATITAVGLTWGSNRSAVAQFDFEKPPIAYSETESHDAVAALASEVQAGKRKLQWSDQQGWLPSLLQQLEISPSSQTLVFSKTSLQLRHISPQTPRAIYFNDNAYVGWVPNGEVIEISAVDDRLGAVFYTLKQVRAERPEIERDQSNCLTCHSTAKTERVPGYLVRSVFPSASGQPHYALGSSTTSHETPLLERFGGWYVTGDLGLNHHRGNKIAANDPQQPFDWQDPQNLANIEGQFNAARYLVNTSDVAALMLLEHQSKMHNLITRANFETRQALSYQATMNRILERDPTFESDSTHRRIQKVADELVRFMLFENEAQLPAPIKPHAEFVKHFEQLGPHDPAGRSLREFDLNTRLLKYPCSYLIYSSTFDSLPARVKDLVEIGIIKALTDEPLLEPAAEPPKFSHLSPEDKEAILAILIATKPAIKKRFNQMKSQ